MGFHFEPSTAIDRVDVRTIIQALKSVRQARDGLSPEVLELCLRRQFLEQCPASHTGFRLTKLGNRMRAGVVGDRVPLSVALGRFEEFMEGICMDYEGWGGPDGEIDTVWLFGSLMRKEPTIGDIDIAISLPAPRRLDPFFSIAEDMSELRHMAIPCQEIAIIREQGYVSWEFRGEPGLYPGATSTAEAAGPVSVDTNRGRFWSGTPEEDMVLGTLGKVRQLIGQGDPVPLPLAATLRRELIARYTEGANSDEPAAAFLNHMEDWRRCPEGRERFREAILAFGVTPAGPDFG